MWSGLPDAPVEAVNLDQAEGLLLAWRNELTPQFRSAAPVEIEALTRLAADERCGPMCAVIADRHGGHADTIGGLLSGWLGDGLIAAG